MTVARAKPPVMSKAVVRLENVGLRYGQGPEVLRDISFSLEKGSFRLTYF